MHLYNLSVLKVQLQCFTDENYGFTVKPNLTKVDFN